MKTISKHTPDRWFVGTMNDCLFIIDRQPRPAPVDYLGAGDPETKVIAKLDYPNAEANAWLLAAAPEMRAALTRILERYDTTDQHCRLADIRLPFEEARAALAKAMRRQP